MAHLDRGAETKSTPALRAAVTLARLAEIGKAGLVVATCLDSLEVPAVVVRTDDELTFAQRLVRDDLAGEGDRAERPPARAERSADLLVRRGTRAPPQRVVELRLAEPVVAADEREHEGAVVP